MTSKLRHHEVGILGKYSSELRGGGGGAWRRIPGAPTFWTPTMTCAKCSMLSFYMQNYGHLLHHNTVWSLHTAGVLISPDFSVALRCHVLLVVAGGRNKDCLSQEFLTTHGFASISSRRPWTVLTSAPSSTVTSNIMDANMQSSCR